MVGVGFNKNINVNSAEQPDYIPSKQDVVYNPRSERRDSTDIKLWLLLFGVSVAAVILVGIALYGFLTWLYAEYDWFFWLVNGATAIVIVSVVAGAAWAIYSFGLALWNKARREALTSLPGGVPIGVDSLAGNASWALSGRFLGVKMMEAERSGLRNVTQYSPSMSYGSTTPVTQEQLPALGDWGMPQDEWVEALNDSPHLLIYGPSKAGKSTIAQAYVSTFAAVQWVVIDPMPNKPGETKWGGADFVTLDEGDGDEFGSIKRALAYIAAEDERRRRTMRTETFPPLVVVVDEVLGLVDALGMLRNAEGKTEPLMSNFIRRMGYSARHRNIKIILIGQGKNLNDLALKSGTARNNYALVRAERNAATDERAAYIVTSEGERRMDTRGVPALAKAATNRARLWLAHADLENDSSVRPQKKTGLRTKTRV